MKVTIEELKEAGKFTVEQWYGVTYDFGNSEGRTKRSGGYKSDEYRFIYDSNGLYVFGSAFGNTLYKVKNELEVLFKVAQEFGQITVKLEGLSFDINNAVLQLDNKK